PRELFDKLDQWGFDTMVIPHGNTWGFYSPPGITWDKQLAGPMHDPQKQFLIEIMSGHGNSEEYRDWHEVVVDAKGFAHCADPTHPRRFRFGIIASSDNHRARPGTGYKELDRHETTEAHGPRNATWRRRINGPEDAPAPRSTVLDINSLAAHGFNALEAERQT